MIDKLMVDNIDVSKCEFLIISNDKHLCRCIKSDLFGAIEFVENARKGNCEDNPNCYFKLLQREKQSSQEARDTSIKEFNRAEELNCTAKSVLQNDKYARVLREIKEIAEENIRIADLEGLNGVYRRGLAEQILQKINEVEEQ